MNDPLEAVETKHGNASLGALAVDVYRGALARAAEDHDGPPTKEDAEHALQATRAFWTAVWTSQRPGDA